MEKIESDLNTFLAEQADRLRVVSFALRGLARDGDAAGGIDGGEGPSRRCRAARRHREAAGCGAQASVPAVPELQGRGAREGRVGRGELLRCCIRPCK